MYVQMVAIWLTMLECMVAQPKPRTLRGNRILKGGTKHDRQMRKGSEYYHTTYWAWPMWNSTRWQRVPSSFKRVTKHANRDYYRANMPGLSSQRRAVHPLDEWAAQDEGFAIINDRIIDTAHPLYYYDAIRYEAERRAEES